MKREYWGLIILLHTECSAIFSHISTYFHIRCVLYIRHMLASGGLWALRKYPVACISFSAFLATVMRFWNEVLVVGCSACVLFCFSSLYDGERKGEISQRLEFHYRVQPNRHAGSLPHPQNLANVSLPLYLMSTFLFTISLPAPALQKTVGLFLYAYVIGRRGKYRICIYIFFPLFPLLHRI